MSLLVKFESKSSRVKGLAFHPTQPWLLVSLHNGIIQLWDYRMGNLMERFEGHIAPVRSVAFHNTQPIFVSGGDDYKVKVWNYKTKTCLFTLSGHVDYIRQVSFHHEHPWILSCSDDQSIRIWNWQSRKNIAVLTGHNHYVMSAVFHATEDLIASASLDETVRIWDITGLRMKHAAPTSSPLSGAGAHEFAASDDPYTLMNRANSLAASQQSDIYGNTDAVVKFVLEGHDRGVNCVAFHSTSPLLISGGDDRVIRLWRINDTKAWELDACRGHSGNVSQICFHSHQDLFISVSEDKTLKVWDLNKRTCLLTHSRENDRFWAVTAHPTMNLFAAGHDSGVMVFKLQRERPAFSLQNNHLLWIDTEKQLKLLQFDNPKSAITKLASFKKFGNQWSPILQMSYNPLERAVIVTSRTEGGVYELIFLPREANQIVESSTESKRGLGDQVVWIARNRFAVLHTNGSAFDIKDLTNSLVRTVKLNDTYDKILQAMPGMCLLISKTKVVLYDTAKRQVTATLLFNGARYAVWSPKYTNVAIFGKHNLAICTKDLQEICSFHETIRIKSAVWEDSESLIYTTLNHLKYALISGDSGTIRTLQNTLYLVKTSSTQAFGLDREAVPRVVSVDSTEYKFKLAVHKANHKEIIRIIKTSNLVGQSVIAFLQKKNHADIALHFVSDPKCRFDLALECGKLDIALEMAKEIGKPAIWEELAKAAAEHTNHQIMELCLQKLKDLKKLCFLYFVTGNVEKLHRLQKVQENHGDFSSLFQTSILSDDVDLRIRTLRENNLHSLAYALAISEGKETLADEILTEANITKDEIKLPENFAPLASDAKKTIHINETFKQSFTEEEPQASAFEQNLVRSLQDMNLETDIDHSNQHDSDAPEDVLIDLDEERTAETAEEEDGAWNDEDLFANQVDASGNADDLESVSAARPDMDYWINSSSAPLNQIAAGSFDSALQVLKKRFNVFDFAPLKPYFMDIYIGKQAYLPTGACLPPLPVYLNENLDTKMKQQMKPSPCYTYETLNSIDLQDATKLVNANKLEEAIQVFRTIIYKSALILGSQNSKTTSLLESLVRMSSVYITALTCELERRKLIDSSKDQPRMLELAACFAASDLQTAHKIIALRSTMNAFFKANNFIGASVYAARLLSFQKKGTAADNAKKIIEAADRKLSDAHELSFDINEEFEVCPNSLTPIFEGSPTVECSFSKSKYHARFKGETCAVCLIAKV